MARDWDVIVVGAGSAGGVAAARLSEDPGRRVLLLEAGPDFPDEAVRPPLFAVSGEHHWSVSGVPELDWDLVDRDRAGRRGGRPIRLPRGRLVGGSSMVNSTIAARPAPFDLDRWASLGATGWGWDDLLPLLRRIETDRDFPDDPLHGRDGPIVVQRYAQIAWAPVNLVFAEGCAALGIRHERDLNGLTGSADCWGTLPHNRFKEVRQGTLVTYLRAARGRPNLTIAAGRTVDRVLLDGTTATGVRHLGADGSAAEARAPRVILAAGVYHSPAILQRSGIGPTDLLRPLGIPVVADLPVGRHLTDHPGVAFFFRTDREVARLTGRLFAANWRGPARDGPEPWWQTHPFPVDEEEGVCGLWTYLCRQHSRGTVAIASPDPRLAPLIDHDYLADRRDLARFADAWEANRALLATIPLRAAGAAWLEPDLDLEAHLLNNLAPAHHQSGTCRIHPDPREGVVDPTLRVHGIDGLFVADTSVFPDTVMHNTNLTAYLVGEVVGEIIRERRYGTA